MRKKFRQVLSIVMSAIFVMAITSIIIAKSMKLSADVVRGLEYSVVFLALALVILFIVIDQVIKKQMIDGLYQLIRDMESIANGNLDVFSCVRGNLEFERMSKGINAMVRSITRTSGMLSRVFEMMDAQFAVFEFNDESKRVTKTHNL